jgi:lysozyme family protein
MAQFLIANSLTKGHEGGYASAAAAAKIKDQGGETYKGFARNFNQDWDGWRIIDAYKAKFGLPAWNTVITALKEPYPGAAVELDKLVDARYKSNFWNVIKGDLIKDQSIANLLYDIGVNSGVGEAAKSVQSVLKLATDGVIGTQTLSKINIQNPATLLHELGDYRKAWLNKYQGSESYLPNLLSRVDSYLTAYAKPAGGGLILGLLAGAIVFFLL